MERRRLTAHETVPVVILLATFRKIQRFPQLVLDLDGIVLCDLAQAAGEAGVGVLAALARAHKIANKGLCDVVPVAPHWSGIENVVRNVQKCVEG
jgi:hypothetical protein